MRIFLPLLFILLPQVSFAKKLSLPIGKGTVPAFTFEAEEPWILKIDRSRGDRWQLLDEKTKAKIVRFDFKLPHTDQRQLPIIAEEKLKLGSWNVQKTTVAHGPFNSEAEAMAETKSLVTSYYFESGKLSGLVLMTPTYDKSSGTEERVEKLIQSISLK
jgi:hypothetical protein